MQKDSYLTKMHQMINRPVSLRNPELTREALRRLSYFAADASIDAIGQLESPVADKKEINRVLDTLHKELYPRVSRQLLDFLMLLFVFPLMALASGIRIIKDVGDSAYSTRSNAYSKIEELPGETTWELYSSAIRENVSSIVDDPRMISEASRRIIASRLPGWPDVEDVDGPHFVFVAGLIAGRATHLLRGRGLWKSILAGQVLFVVLVAIIFLVNRERFLLGLMVLLLALAGCGIAGFIQASLLDGYDHSVVATIKTLAKIPTALAVVVGLSTTLSLRGQGNSMLLAVSILATLLLSLSSLIADLLINHAEAALKKS